MKGFALIFACLVLAACSSSPTKMDQHRAILHMEIGTSYLVEGHYPQAISELLKAKQLDPRNPLILNNLGLAYYVRGRMQQAEAEFRAAIHELPAFSDAKNNLGRLLIDTGRSQAALTVLHQVEGDLTYQQQEKTFSNLGMAYFELGQYDKAEDYLARSLAIRRDSCATADYYGRTLFELKRWQQATVALDQAIDFCRANKFEEPIYFSAMSYFSLGNKEKSRARVEELLKDYPKSKYVAKAKGMLELLDQ